LHHFYKYNRESNHCRLTRMWSSRGGNKNNKKFLFTRPRAYIPLI